jgi:hypothetical protein
MQFKTFYCGVMAGLMVGVPTVAAADQGCCSKDHKQPCCAAMVCCDDKDHPEAVAVLIPPVRPEPRPIRETMVVRFSNPVKVGDRILLGTYIIEHDNNRMAQGRPCTHIYEASDPRLPVVRFHCTHLHRPAGAQPTVTLTPLGEPNGIRELTAFQFAGEKGAHGVPEVR